MVIQCSAPGLGSRREANETVTPRTLNKYVNLKQLNNITQPEPGAAAAHKTGDVGF